MIKKKVQCPRCRLVFTISVQPQPIQFPSPQRRIQTRGVPQEEMGYGSPRHQAPSPPRMRQPPQMQQEMCAICGEGALSYDNNRGVQVCSNKDCGWSGRVSDSAKGAGGTTL